MKPFTADHVRLGFVGVGAMGSRLVRRLIAHGYRVTVFDHNQSAVEALRESGASSGKSLAELAENADVILSCLTDDNAVRSVYLGRDGIFDGIRRCKAVIEMSTISPQTSREIHAQGYKQGVDVMDVAISGSTPAVEQGTITLLVGGEAQLFDAAEPIFHALASQSYKSDTVFRSLDAVGPYQALHPLWICFPVRVMWKLEETTVKLKRSATAGSCSLRSCAVERVWSDSLAFS